MEFRRATREDIDAFTDYRLEFVTSIRYIANVDEFKSSTKTYFMKHIDSNDLEIFIAINQGTIVSACMACIFETAPLPSCPSGRIAELLNVYTKTEYRRRGLAEKIILMMLDALRQDKVQKVILEYTDAGHPLYKKIGFIENNRQMDLKL